MILKLIQLICRTFFRVLSVFFSCCNLPAIIYDNLITIPLTKGTYLRILKQLQPNMDSVNRVLDIGTGTGKALKAIIDQIPSRVQVTGIDIDKYYIQRAQKLFKGYKNVTMKLQDFYDLKDSNEKYDTIIFSSSFMLMPDQKEAIEIAKSLLTPGGRIYFVMTLYDKKKGLTEKLKPIIKDFTTIDFGKVTYENEFDNILKEGKLNVLLKERISIPYNPTYKLFRVFFLECIPN